MNVNQPYSKKRFRVAIPMGDPAGIGTEIILKSLESSCIPKSIEPILIGCRSSMNRVHSQLKSKGVISLKDPNLYEFNDLPINEKFNLGEPSRITGEASFQWLNCSIDLVLTGKANAIATAPISKYAWHQAGHYFAGQTEFLAAKTGVENTSMLFTAQSPMNEWRLNTLLATTHIPLEEVTKKLSQELILSKLDTLLEFCKRFKDNPRLQIAGINPHAGEEGQMGVEEKNLLIPAIEKWKNMNPGIVLEGPVPPDTCWISSAKRWAGIPNTNNPDGILALYHDQGLIPIKLIAFENAVNTTLGLPFIRTSPDHGTAFDIAELGVANPQSMIEAIKTAWELSKYE